ncbi:hypothetical protein MAR_008468 [Mya arenaria]|uniref:DDE Tnp4 domain-containing protein n=1 Tax=Mya arenaria TaxID=6604 RepID=A0ABY7DW11_MYAAR|nr:hypothetical protein MAR_008468 [Mya arenaria]
MGESLRSSKRVTVKTRMVLNGSSRQNMCTYAASISLMDTKIICKGSATPCSLQQLALQFNNDGSSSEHLQTINENTEALESTESLYATRLTAFDKPVGAPTFHEAPCLSSTPMSNKERSNLFTEIHNLRKEKDDLMDKLKKEELCKMSTSVIKDNDEKSKFYTRLKWVLRQNPRFQYLADQAGAGKSTIIDMFLKWIGIMNSKLGFLLNWRDRDSIFEATPAAFKARFPRHQLLIASKSSLKIPTKAQCYSNYKKHTTVKFLIACNTRGTVIFLSNAWGGRVSDIELTRKSNFISRSLHLSVDQILADRRFTLQEDFASVCCAELILPSFTSRQLASVKILVERVIGLVKNRYAILQGTLLLQLVNSKNSESMECDFSSVDLILGACAILTNLGEGIQN